MLPTSIVGKKFEKVAELYLKKNKFKILATNFSAPCGEVDIIAKDKTDGYIVFVEVKYRTTALYGRPIEAINAEKVRKIHMTSQVYLKLHGWLDKPIRFDAIEVLDDQVRHIKNAF